MRWKVLFGLFGASVLLGAGNNALSAHRVAWIGSPEVLPKPEGWPALTLGQGLGAAAHFAWQGAREHAPIVAAVVLLLLAGLALFRGSGASRGRWIRSWLRLGLGAMFLAAAYPKLTDPRDFALLVAQYQFLPAFAVNAFSVWLPAFEISVGLSLLLLPCERESAAGVGLLLLMFIVALGQALARGLGIACGCFDIAGASDAGETWFALVRDVVLLVPVAWMCLRAERRSLWRF